MNNQQKRKIIEQIKNNELTIEEGSVIIEKLYLPKSRIAQEDKKLSTPASETTLYYNEEWERSESENHDSGTRIFTQILVFDTGDDLSSSIQIGFDNGNINDLHIITVKPGNKYTEKTTRVYEIDPASENDYKKLTISLKERGFIPRLIIHAWSQEKYKDGASISRQLDIGAYSVFYLTKALAELKYHQVIRMLYIYSYQKDKIEPQYAAVGGLAKSVFLENSKLIYKIIGIESLPGVSLAIEPILYEIRCFSDEHIEICYLEGKRYIKRLKAFEFNRSGLKNETRFPLIKENGVYIITGGTGFLGMALSKYLAKEFRARLVLSGRSGLNEINDKKIKEIESLGSEVLYVKSDITSRKDVVKLVLEAKSRFKEINGIIHSAGVKHDSLIFRKSHEEIASVLAPKVYGTVYLDEATNDDKLDFFVLFSSLAAETGNIGQGDYAYANSFMDKYSYLREDMRANNKRYGKTLSINWPLWKEGGMTVDKNTTKWMKDTLGLTPLSNEKGVKAFMDGLHCINHQMLVLHGDTQKIKNKFFKLQRVRKKYESGRLAQNTYNEIPKDTKELFDRTVLYIKKMLSKTLKLSFSKIDPKEPFEKYGIDSLMIMELTRMLENVFGELPKTLFFEYQTLEELARYFVENYSDILLMTIKEPYPERLVKEQALSCNKGIQKPLSRLKRSRFKENAVPKMEKPAIYNGDIAIIGINGRYPQARDLNEFWENLKEGKDCISEIPPERWDIDNFFNPDRSNIGTSYSKWGGFIEDVDKFDASFFNITPKEAELIDPQERLFLETVWHTIEDAGYTRKALRNTIVGVFVGVMWGQYQLYAQNINGYALRPTSSYASIANRVSYYFDFNGPSIALDTMCSSSLTAMNLAVNSIHFRECEAAIAGGVNVSIHPAKYIQLSFGKFTSSDGRCKSFGLDGDGYVPGEGVGAVMLKPLKAAQRDGDPIYAVLKGISVNHGGKTNGYTVPNPKAQSEVILKTLQKAKIDPRRLSYLEAHGTGTSLGDSIEIRGLTKAFNKYTNEKQYCPIGSVKSNIGHLESAAAISGLTKVLLQMKNKKLVPSIHSEKLNPNIKFEDSPFYVQRELTNWKKTVLIENGIEKEYPRLAGISSFGAGGSNGHIIVEEYDPAPEAPTAPTETNEGPCLIVLSAKNEERLKAYARKMAVFLEKSFEPEKDGKPLQSSNVQKNDNLSLVNIAYTLQKGREAMEERLAVVADTVEELWEKLSRYSDDKGDIDNLFTGCSGQNNWESSHLLEGRSGREFIRLIIEDGELAKIAHLWVSGTELEWEILYSKETPRRISLPVYPFAKVRHWIECVKNNENLAFVKKITSIQIGKSEALNRKPDAPPIDSGGSETSVEEIVTTIISERTGLKKKTLQNDTALNEIGVDSILMIQIGDDLTKRFPFLKSKGDELLFMTKIGQIANYIEKHADDSDNGMEKSEKLKIEKELLKINSLQKKNVLNILNRALKVSAITPLELESELIVDESHPFFFDHPLDHVSGLQLIDAMSQLCRNGLVLKNRSAKESTVAITKATVTFKKFCKKSNTAFVSCREFIGKNNGHICFKGTVVQDGNLLTEGVFQFAEPATALFQEKISSNSSINLTNDLVPCPKDVVNKKDANNVLITDAVKQGSWIGCKLLPLREDLIFSDNQKSRHLDAVHIIEACRQSFRAMEYFIRENSSSDEAFQQEQRAGPGTMGILKSTELSLDRPIQTDEPVYFKTKEDFVSKFKTGSNMLIINRIIICINDREVGNFEIKVLLLNHEVYKSMRNDGVVSALQAK